MLKPLNKTIRALIFYDFILLFGWGLVYPILSIFIVGNINGGNVRMAGISVGIYWITSSLVQIPAGIFLDKKKGEGDDLALLAGGTFLTGVTPFFFGLAYLPWHIYLLLFIYALGMGTAMPAWFGIFTRHIDKRREAQSWAVNQSFIGIGAGLAGICGGIIAGKFGFHPLFFLVGIAGLISTVLCLLVKKGIV